MDYTANSHPTRFISMAASSLDTTLLSNSSLERTVNVVTKPQQMRFEKQYISPNSMIQFEHKMNALGNEFEKARNKLRFSTTSLQTQLIQDSFALSPNHSISHSLNTNTNTNQNILPISSISLPAEPNAISSIGTAIDKRLQNLRAKLHKLEKEDEIKKIYKRNTKQRNEDTSISLPILSKDTLNTSFAQKYEKYMQKYHGSTDKTYDYNNKSRNNINTQHLLSKIQQKSKELFKTDIDYRKRPHIVDDINTQKRCNFEDELNATWTKTELQLNKIKSMNQHFKQRNKAEKVISVTQSTASSHWTLDSQCAQSMHIPSLNVIDEGLNTEQKNEDEENVSSPILCSRCRKCLDRNDIAFMKNKNKNVMVDDEEKYERNNNNYVSNDQILSRSSSSSFIQNKIETTTTMSESDRKQLIIDLKSMDHHNNDDIDNKWYNNSDCNSDGILFDNKIKSNKQYSLRQKLNDLRMDINNNNIVIKHNEYAHLQHKLKRYEEKLRSIDPSLLE